MQKNELEKPSRRFTFLNFLYKLFDYERNHNSITERLGKTEKFVLMYSLKYLIEQRGFKGIFGKQSLFTSWEVMAWLCSVSIWRRNMVLKYYQYEQNEKANKYKKNLKKYIPSEQYNRFQSNITRSLKTLEKKHLIQLNDYYENMQAPYKSYFGKHARRSFVLTERGILKAIDLMIESYKKVKSDLSWGG